VEDDVFTPRDAGRQRLVCCPRRACHVHQVLHDLFGV
jgi:hypothetical protein